MRLGVGMGVDADVKASVGEGHKYYGHYENSYVERNGDGDEVECVATEDILRAF